MKTFTLTIAFLLFTNIGLFAQSGMTIKSGGAVTVNGNLTIIPTSFTCGSPITDTRDGKTYSTVQIGTQCWMAQNLNVGTKILGTANQTNNGIIKKYCYNDDENNCNVYGGLYQWDEAMQYVTTEGAQGICPSGWHLPSDGEWTTLTDDLGGVVPAGGKMKSTGTLETGTGLWAAPNTGATNISGFTAIPSGFCWSGNSEYVSFNAYYWSSSQYDTMIAWCNILNYSVEYLYRSRMYYKTDGFSIRCVKD